MSETSNRVNEWLLSILVCKVCDACMVAFDNAAVLKLMRRHEHHAHPGAKVVFERRYALKAILCQTCDVMAFVEDSQWKSDHVKHFNHPNYSVVYSQPPENSTLK